MICNADSTFDLKAKTIIFSDLMIRENKQGNQLPELVFEWFPFTSQGKRNSTLGLVFMGDCLKEVKITVIKGNNFRDFDN